MGHVTWVASLWSTGPTRTSPRTPQARVGAGTVGEPHRCPKVIVSLSRSTLTARGAGGDRPWGLGSTTDGSGLPVWWGGQAAGPRLRRARMVAPVSAVSCTEEAANRRLEEWPVSNPVSIAIRSV
jgi:hypothetical protein